jgi:hypothetical protein
VQLKKNKNILEKAKIQIEITEAKKYFSIIDIASFLKQKGSFLKPEC